MAAFSFYTIICIALILAIAVPSSLGHKHHHHHHKHHHKHHHHHHHHKHHHKHHHHHHHHHHREESDIEEDLRDLCFDTRDSDKCWYIIKPELHRFDDNNWWSVADVVIDLARAKAEEIHDKLHGWYRDSNDDSLKEKYHSCSKNYDEAVSKLDSARINLDSDDYQNIFIQVDDTERELESCRREFNQDSFDPGHVEGRNNEFGNYVDIVNAVIRRLQRED